MYVNDNKNEAIVFNFLVRKEVYPKPSTIILQGLDPGKKYKLKEINKDPDDWSRFSKYEDLVLSGEYLMTVGLNFAMYNEMESLVFKLNEVK